MKFKLKKWYMDLVNPEGGAFIGYCALARLGPLPLKYASALELSAGGVAGRGGALGVMEPEAGENGLFWSFEGKEAFSCGPLDLPAGKRVLLDDGRGRITWHCRAASAPGRAAGAGEGLAYCESLEMELEKFRLPIETLYWGHFSAPGRSLVWLKWEGPAPLSLLLLDGKETGGGSLLRRHSFRRRRACLRRRTGDTQRLYRRNGAGFLPGEEVGAPAGAPGDT